jgi:hypothetical protein
MIAPTCAGMEGDRGLNRNNVIGGQMGKTSEETSRRTDKSAMVLAYSPRSDP